MKYTSTRSSDREYNFTEILLLGIPDDGGLFVPIEIPAFNQGYFDNILNKSFHELAFDVARIYIDAESVPDEELKHIIVRSFNFVLPLIKLQKDLSVLELFHGPTSAFKDFGARFMANILGHIRKKLAH